MTRAFREESASFCRKATASRLLLAGLLIASVAGCGETEPTVVYRNQMQQRPLSRQTRQAAKSTAAPVKNFTMVELSRAQGPLGAQLKSQAVKAKLAGRKPFVEVTAGWCPACRDLKRRRDHPLMIDAFDGTYIIELDADDWMNQFAAAGLSVSSVPTFLELNSDGRPTGRQIDGSTWDADVPPEMARTLKSFFEG